MFIVESYPLAVAMCVVTMLCWGSWANTQKLAAQEWRFQLFYWDYAFGVFLFSIVLAFTLGSNGEYGRGFVADLLQADSKWLWSAFLGGGIFNLSNILLAAAAKACARLRSRGVPTVILTLGRRGAFLADSDGQQHIPGFKVRAVDTTAAGDIFNGALAVALAEGKPVREAVRFASAAAALAVTRLGAQPSAPKRRDVDLFLKRGG
jgi:hypothetical protein